ncbi:MAG: hypothetical protein CMH60_00505 [Myxococcales bacterium]|nr:hypothetical protein [Myxococcales bacterium]
MDILNAHLLSLITFLPLLGAVLLLTFPRHEGHGARGFTLGLSLVEFLISLLVWQRFVPSNTGMQLVEKVEWIPTLGISYSLGIDGLTLLLVLLTTALMPLVILSTYSSVEKYSREYCMAMLVLQTGMLGAFLATDLFLFYLFWEAMLIPMYFLIGIWGGQRRIYAAIKFFLYTMAGSLLMLVAIIYTVWTLKDQGGITFSWAELTERLASTNLGTAELWLFAAFALAFAIKVPMFPFHTWLPDAHVEAPTGGSVILAGVLLKLGTFGFLRYAMWLFPKAAVFFIPSLTILAVIGIIYGALVAMIQKDLKRLVAYSSVSHLGFVMLGLLALEPTSTSGAVLQMVNHGISTGALFLLVGVIYERRHTRELSEFGGLAKVMPRYAVFFIIIALSSMGLPGLNGFVGEFMILLGAFQSPGLPLTFSTAELAQTGVYLLQLFALIAIILVSRKVWSLQNAQRGQITLIFTFVLSIVVALILVGPPLASFKGGLLTQPLLSVASDTEPFREIFALLSAIGALGVIFAAVYLLIAVQALFYGELSNQKNQNLKDLSGRETLIFVPFILAVVILGVYPKPCLDAIQPTVNAYVKHIRQGAGLTTLQKPAKAKVKKTVPARNSTIKSLPSRNIKELKVSPRGKLLRRLDITKPNRVFKEK